jgi:hypothetical protein
LRADVAAAVRKHNICRNYGSAFQIHFGLSLCVYVESILRIHIYERIHRSKPPISRRSHIHIPLAIVTDVSQVLIFVLCPFICFSPFY